MAKAYLAMKNFEKGLELLMKGGDLLSTDEENQNMLEQRSFLYIEIADLLKKKGLLTEALDFKVRAFEFFAETNKYAMSDVLAELASSLSLWLEENN
jgi:tetratricopeptide (TPR) repeat protein